MVSPLTLERVDRTISNSRAVEDAIKGFAWHIIAVAQFAEQNDTCQIPSMVVNIAGWITPVSLTGPYVQSHAFSGTHWDDWSEFHMSEAQRMPRATNIWCDRNQFVEN
jgi:hypothetical protein